MRGRDEGGRDDQGTKGLEDQGTRGPKKEKNSQKKKKKIPKINTSPFVLCSAATATEALDMEGLGCLVFCAFFISDAFHTSKIVWINYFNSCKAFDHFPKEHEFHIFWKTNENLVGPWAFSNASKLCGSKTCLGFGSTLHQWARSLMQGDFLETSKSAGNAKFRAKLSKNSIRWHLYEGCSKFFHVEKDIFSFAEL